MAQQPNITALERLAQNIPDFGITAPTMNGACIYISFYLLIRNRGGIGP
jgi:hypothetical protein